MASWTPDPSFYPSPRMAMKAAPETLAYVAAFDPDRKIPDAIAVVDVDPKSKSYSTIIGSTAMPNAGDELHHFGWNACSSCLCPNAPHAHAERRYLVVPGLRQASLASSNDAMNMQPIRRAQARRRHCFPFPPSDHAHGFLGAGGFFRRSALPERETRRSDAATRHRWQGLSRKASAPFATGLKLRDLLPRSMPLGGKCSPPSHATAGWPD
jgi:hypothetical protein